MICQPLPGSALLPPYTRNPNPGPLLPKPTSEADRQDRTVSGLGHIVHSYPRTSIVGGPRSLLTSLLVRLSVLRSGGSLPLTWKIDSGAREHSPRC